MIRNVTGEDYCGACQNHGGLAGGGPWCGACERGRTAHRQDKASVSMAPGEAQALYEEAVRFGYVPTPGVLLRFPDPDVVERWDNDRTALRIGWVDFRDPLTLGDLRAQVEEIIGDGFHVRPLFPGSPVISLPTTLQIAKSGFVGVREYRNLGDGWGYVGAGPTQAHALVASLVGSQGLRHASHAEWSTLVASLNGASGAIGVARGGGSTPIILAVGIDPWEARPGQMLARLMAEGAGPWHVLFVSKARAAERHLRHYAGQLSDAAEIVGVELASIWHVRPDRTEVLWGTER